MFEKPSKNNVRAVSSPDPFGVGAETVALLGRACFYPLGSEARGGFTLWVEARPVFEFQSSILHSTPCFSSHA